LPLKKIPDEPLRLGITKT